MQVIWYIWNNSNGDDQGVAVAIQAAPHDTTTEAAVLGCLLMEPEAAAALAAPLDGAEFTLPAHQLIWRAITRLQTRGAFTGLLAVTTDLQAHGEYDRAGGLVALSRLADAVEHISYGPRYVARVRELSLRRRLLALGHRLTMQASNPEADLARAVTAAARELETITRQMEMPAAPTPRRFVDV